jgi:hypothetical protein
VTARNQINDAAGVEIEASSTLTLVGDLVGRRLLGGGQLGYRSVTFAVPFPASTDLLLALPKGLNVVSVAPGLKWNVARSALLSTKVLVSLANKGIRANVTPVLGAEWTS